LSFRENLITADSSRNWLPRQEIAAFDCQRVKNSAFWGKIKS